MISVFQKFILLSQCFGFTLLSFGRGEYIKFIRSGSWDPVKVYFFFGVSIFREVLLGHQQGPPTTNIAQRFPFQEPRKLLRINCHVTRSFIQEAICKGLDTPTGLHEIVQYSYVTPSKEVFLKVSKTSTSIYIILGRH